MRYDALMEWAEVLAWGGLLVDFRGTSLVIRYHDGNGEEVVWQVIHLERE